MPLRFLSQQQQSHPPPQQSHAQQARLRGANGPGAANRPPGRSSEATEFKVGPAAPHRSTASSHYGAQQMDVDEGGGDGGGEDYWGEDGGGDGAFEEALATTRLDFGGGRDVGGGYGEGGAGARLSPLVGMLECSLVSPRLTFLTRPFLRSSRTQPRPRAPACRPARSRSSSLRCATSRSSTLRRRHRRRGRPGGCRAEAAARR